MSDYIVQPIDSQSYNVHKFEAGGDKPSVSYKVTQRNSKMTCNCPSGRYRGYCKHVDYVKSYLKQAPDSMIVFEEKQ